MFNKNFWFAVFTLTSTIIGAGILALPYVFSNSGFFIGLFWLLFVGGIYIYICLCLGEISLRTKDKRQLPGYAELYLGKKGKTFMFLVLAFGIYSALIAYLIGEGQSLSKIFTGGLEYSLYFGIGFWVLMTFLLSEGLRSLKRVTSIGIFMVVFLVFYVFFFNLSSINITNILVYDFSKFLFPFGVVLFALLGFSSVPEMRMLLQKQEKKLVSAIFIGKLIPILLYIIFSLTFVGVLGKSVPEVATLAFGGIILVLGIFTMLSCYFVLSFVLKDVFKYDFKKGKLSLWLVSFVPLCLYILVSLFHLDNFVKIISLGGAISGGISAVLILLMNLKAKKIGNRKPEFSVPINWFIIGFFSLVFLLGIFASVFL